MRVLNGIQIKAEKETILAKLHENRARHKTIVEEARAGYVEKAKRALLDKLKEVKEGKIVALTFHLSPPQDYTAVYDTAIRMFELDMGDLVTLNSEQVRNLVMDEWDWTDHFLAANKHYSGTAMEFANIKGV